MPKKYEKDGLDMKIGIFIDYANLFINIKNEYGFSSNEQVEKYINCMISKLEDYLYLMNSELTSVDKTAYMLEDQGFGNPQDTLVGIKVKKVKSDYKTDEMKKMNQSQHDDEVLMSDALESCEMFDVILVVSNDGDFSSLGKKIASYTACNFWVGTYCGINCRPSRYLTSIADKVIPLDDLMNDIDEADAQEVYEDPIVINDHYIAVYYKGRNIMNYPLDKDYINIGRRSLRKFHLPNIDLSEFDKEKTTSRQHCFICKSGNNIIFGVDDKCSRGTWVDKEPLKKGEQVILKPGMEIVIGDPSDGFGLEYIL